MKKPVVLKAEGLTKTFGQGETKVCAVRGIDIELSKGEITLIMGPSGSGKTTFVSMLGTLLRPTSGSIVVDGKEITELPESKMPEIRAKNIGFIFQSFNLLDALTVEENIVFPARVMPGGVKKAKDRADVLIDRFSLSHRRKALPGYLSGGEKQRVAIARALINRPSIVLADEPTGNLDSRSGQEVLMALYDLSRDENCAVLVVSHDPRVEEMVDRIMWLEDGKLADRKETYHEWAVDPVCKMRVDTLTTDHKVTLDNGMTYYFCSIRCQQRFISEKKGDDTQ